jgi:PAS domain S-box-containing protein
VKGNRRKPAESPIAARSTRWTIALLVDSVGDGATSQLWEGAAEAAAERGAHLYFSALGTPEPRAAHPSPDDPSIMPPAVQRADGLIAWTRAAAEAVSWAGSRPLVFMHAGAPGFPVVKADIQGGMREILGHFLDAHGRRRISIMMGRHSPAEEKEILRFFRETLADRGVAFEPGLVSPPFDPSEAKSTASMGKWLSNLRQAGADALLASTDKAALWAISTAQALGMRVPEDIAIAGFSDIPEDIISVPALTTCRPLHHRMGRMAVELLLDSLDGESGEKPAALPGLLIRRGSCGCPHSPEGELRRAAADGRNAAGKAAALRETSSAIAAASTTQELAETLAQRLPAMGVLACFVSQYESSREWARLVLAFDRRGVIDPGQAPRRFAAGQLAPEGMLDRDSPGRFIVMQLRFRGSSQGFAVFEAGPGEGDACETLSAQLSGALYGAILSRHEEKRARQLQAAAVVSHAASSSLDSRELMQRTVDVIRDRFGLSYAGLFLLDDSGRYAVLRAGTGEAGDALVKRGYRIEVGGASLVGACIATLQAAIGPVGGRESVPLLPQARTEMAVPLASQERVFGALTMLSPEPAAFDDEDLKMAQTMADQLAGVIDNARLLEERRRVERSLEQERNLLRTLVDHIPDYIYVKDPQSRFLLANKSVSSLMGAASPEEVLGKTDFDFYPPTLAEKYSSDERRLVESGKPMLNYEEYTVDTKGAIRWALTSKVPLRDDQGGLLGFVGIGRDITERKKSEETLRVQSVRLQMALEVAGAVTSLEEIETVLPRVADLIREKFGFYAVSVFLLDETGKWATLRAASGAALWGGLEDNFALEVGGRSMVGYVTRSAEPRIAQDVAEDPFYLALPQLPNTRSKAVIPLIVGDTVIGALDVQSAQTGVFTPDSVTILKTLAYQLATAVQKARLQTVEREHARALEQAYRALQENQERALISEKMASLGRLTAGIAHEMNTLLAALRAALVELGRLVEEYGSAIGDGEVTEEDHRQIAQEMKESIGLANVSAEKAAGFLRGIKTQTRDIGRVDRQLFNAVPVIREALLLLGHALRKGNCEASFQPAVDPVELNGSPGRLAQVVTNLVANAIDASAAKGGGAITVSLTPRAASVELVVADMGSGIPPENLSRIFEPLFTTKPIGVGTGLGLTIVHDIVVGEFGGAIDVASEPGQGAVFSVRFPRQEKAL